MLPNTTDIERAYGLIEPHIRKTPLFDIEGKPFGLENPVQLKLEMLQHVGVFKTRGAFYNLLSRDIPPAGVAAASGGNHGAAVAFAAARLGIKAKIFVPEISSPSKIERIRASGAEVVVKGARYADALELCETYQAETGAEGLHAYDGFHTICGQGTLGLEWEKQAGEKLPDTILVAVGGGGLISGLASWFKKRVKIIGVEPDLACALKQARDAGHPVNVPVSGIAADSLGAKRCGEDVFEVTKDNIHDVITLPDKAILKAQAALWTDYRLAVEAGGAAAFAALHQGFYKPEKKERVGIVMCGANVELEKLNKVISQV